MLAILLPRTVPLSVDARYEKIYIGTQNKEQFECSHDTDTGRNQLNVKTVQISQ